MCILLTRDNFRNSVFARDQMKCVVCGFYPAKDSHHIMERRLFADEGYYLDNGVSLCTEHHLAAEMTTLSCEDLREKAYIKNIILPTHLYPDTSYDKWGNIILESGNRLKGELFYDESVQKILKQGNVLNLFQPYVKYPRTFHLPWSPGYNKDDRVLTNTDHFKGKEVVVTIKMDGENTTMYNNYIHARSITSNPHPSRNWVKSYHAKICGDIPNDWRICGENLYAKHSILYNNLNNYFLVFSIWNDRNICLSWKDMIEWCSLMNLDIVPVIYEGIWDEDLIKSLWKDTYNGDECEGYVVRLKDSFSYKDFSVSIAKYVRRNHITTHGHWLRSRLELNKIKDK